MAITQRALLLTALLITCFAGAASADSVAPVGTPDFLAGFGAAAGRALSRLPESGALLLFGTALAAVARVVGGPRQPRK